MARPYDKGAILTAMRPLRDRGAITTFSPGQRVPSLPAVVTSVLDRVRDRGVLRVGYFEDSLPYVFVNGRGELVGFDVEMAAQLARDLGVRAELVPINRAVIETGLDPAICDPRHVRRGRDRRALDARAVFDVLSRAKPSRSSSPTT